MPTLKYLLDTLELALHTIVGRPPLLGLRLGDLPQLVDRRHLARQRTLSDVGHPADKVLGCHAVGDRGGLDADDADSGVVGGAVVDSVAEVANPGLEGWAVVLLDEASVGDDLGHAADGGPLARAVDEGDVDVGVCRELIGLVRLGVGVEEEVNASALLHIRSMR